jgi:hypothetical protein
MLLVLLRRSRRYVLVLSHVRFVVFLSLADLNDVCRVTVSRRQTPRTPKNSRLVCVLPLRPRVWHFQLLMDITVGDLCKYLEGQLG